MKGYLWEGQSLTAGVSPLGAQEGRAYFGITQAIAACEAPKDGAVAELSWNHAAFSLDGERGVIARQEGTTDALARRARALGSNVPAVALDDLPGLWRKHGYRLEDMARIAADRPLWAGVSVPDLYVPGWEHLMAAVDTVFLSPRDPLDIPRIDEPLAMLRERFPNLRRLLVCPLWDALNGRPLAMGYLIANWKALPRLYELGLIDGFVLKGTCDIPFCPEQATYVQKIIGQLA